MYEVKLEDKVLVVVDDVRKAIDYFPNDEHVVSTRFENGKRIMTLSNGETITIRKTKVDGR